MIAAIALDVSSARRRAGAANNSFAFFLSRLAGEKLGRRGASKRDQEQTYFRPGPTGKPAGGAPIARIVARDAERAPERGVSA
jgi:hypothetical protein